MYKKYPYSNNVGNKGGREFVSIYYIWNERHNVWIRFVKFEQKCVFVGFEI